MPANYEIQFTVAELFWLIKAFKINRLPLPEFDNAGYPIPEAGKKYTQAQISLEARTMIRKSGAGWEVDHLPAALVHWLANAKNMVKMTYLKRAGDSSRLSIFLEKDGALSVETKDESMDFVIYQNIDDLESNLIERLNASFADIKPSTSKYEIPQPEAIIRAAWNDKKMTEDILKKIGRDEKKSRSTIKWLDSLLWIAILSQVNLESQSARIESQTFLCGDDQKVWAGIETMPGQNDAVTLASIAVKNIGTLIKDIL